MFRKKLLALLLCMLIIITSVGCGSTKDNADANTDSTNQESTENNTMVIGVRDDSRVIHPLYGDDRTTLTLINNIFSTLFDVNGENIEYNLAEKVERSDDYLEYTLKLKDNLKWHDDKKITSDDIIFSLETILDEKQASLSRDNFVTSSGPVKFEKVDDLTVKLTLPEVDISFLGKIGDLRIFPKHIYGGIENIQTSDVNQTPIGSGPYKWDSRKSGESITLTRFDDYFKGQPHLEKIIYRVLPDSNTSTAAFKNKEIDVKYIYPEDVDTFKKDGAKILAFDEDRVGYIFMNQNNEALKNKEIRQAICYAIDRLELLKARYISTEYAHPAKTFLAEKALYLNDEVNDYAYNPEKSKELIKNSGLKNIKFNLAFIGKNDTEGLLIQKYLNDVGIEVELKPMDAGAFFNALYSPDTNDVFDLALNGYIYGKDPSDYAQVFKTDSPNNLLKYSNPEIDKLWDNAATEIDSSKRELIYKDIQKKIMDDAPIFPISYGYAIVVVNPKFEGLEDAKPAPIHMFDDLSQIYIKK